MIWGKIPLFVDFHPYPYVFLHPPSGSFGGQPRNAPWHVHGGFATTLSLQGVGDAVHAIGFGGEVELVLQLPWGCWVGILVIIWVSCWDISFGLYGFYGYPTVTIWFYGYPWVFFSGDRQGWYPDLNVGKSLWEIPKKKPLSTWVFMVIIPQESQEFFSPVAPYLEDHPMDL